MAVELKNTLSRLNVVEKGMTQYIKTRTNRAFNIADDDYKPTVHKTKLYVYNPAKDPKEISIDEKHMSIKSDLKQTVSEDNFQNTFTATKKYATVKEKIETITKMENVVPKIELSRKEKEILHKLELEHEKAERKQIPENVLSSQNVNDKTEVKQNDVNTSKASTKPHIKPSIKPKQSVSIIYNTFSTFYIYIYHYSFQQLQKRERSLLQDFKEWLILVLWVLVLELERLQNIHVDH